MLNYWNSGFTSYSPQYCLNQYASLKFSFITTISSITIIENAGKDPGNPKGSARSLFNSGDIYWALPIPGPVSPTCKKFSGKPITLSPPPCTAMILCSLSKPHLSLELSIPPVTISTSSTHFSTPSGLACIPALLRKNQQTSSLYIPVKVWSILTSWNLNSCIKWPPLSGAQLSIQLVYKADSFWPSRQLKRSFSISRNS